MSYPASRETALSQEDRVSSLKGHHNTVQLLLNYIRIFQPCNIMISDQFQPRNMINDLFQPCNIMINGEPETIINYDISETNFIGTAYIAC